MIEEHKNKNMTTLPNALSKPGTKVLADLVKEILQNQGCVPSLRNGYLSLSRSVCVVVGYTTCLGNYVEQGDSIGHCPELQNHRHYVAACNKSESIRKIQNSFVLIAGNAENG